MQPNISIFFVFIVSLYHVVYGQQDVVTFSEDSAAYNQLSLTNNEIDSIVAENQQSSVDLEKPDPVQTVWLGAVIPGYGQIVNKKYWKLPIVYGGFIGCTFAISWNADRFTSYKNAYLDITDGDSQTNSFIDIIPPGFTIESYGGEAAFTNLLKSGMDQARYNRDLSIIVSVAFYGLTLIDAFVDAHLQDFDISPDLSMKIRPVILQDQVNMNKLSNSFTFGFAGSVNF